MAQLVGLQAHTLEDSLVDSRVKLGVLNSILNH